MKDVQIRAANSGGSDLDQNIVRARDWHFGLNDSCFFRSFKLRCLHDFPPTIV
jgi:hypothetical protein